MRVLLAPDCFGGTMSAREAADAMAQGWADGAPHDDVVRLPLADGGPGFVETLHGALGGDLVPVTVTGPLGDRVPAVVLVRRGDGGTVAYVEAAQAVGLHLVPAGRRDPTAATSRGVGELVVAAGELGAQRVVVGLGGSGTNDAGAGALAALGAGGGALSSGGGALGGVHETDLAGLAAARARLASTDLVAAVDVDVPLLGLHGASAGFAAQKGATPEQAQHLERCLGHFADVVERVLRDVPHPRTRLTTGGHHEPLSRRPGAGAGGGLGFGLAVLGARLLPGAEVVAHAVGLDARVAEADLVVTGEGALDWQSLHGKVVAAVARRGLTSGTPVVAVAGQVHLGRREWGAAGLAGAYAVAERPQDLERALADPVGTLAARTARVARTWSPPPGRPRP